MGAIFAVKLGRKAKNNKTAVECQSLENGRILLVFHTLGTHSKNHKSDLSLSLYIYIQGVASIEPKENRAYRQFCRENVIFENNGILPAVCVHKMHFFFSRSRMPYSKINYKTRHFWRHYKTQICHFFT